MMCFLLKKNLAFTLSFISLVIIYICCFSRDTESLDEFKNNVKLCAERNVIVDVDAELFLPFESLSFRDSSSHLIHVSSDQAQELIRELGSPRVRFCAHCLNVLPMISLLFAVALALLFFVRFSKPHHIFTTFSKIT